MTIYSKISIGCDPEVFLIDAKTHNFISSIGKFGGSKQKPLPILNGEGAIQEDNVALEFNIKPALTKEEWTSRISKVWSHVSKLAYTKGLLATATSFGTFSDEQLEHPKALEFGCEPDYNVWEGAPNPRPTLSYDDMNLRTCGGHIHIGYENPTEEASKKLIKALDVFVGVPSRAFDPDTVRLKLYGKAGSCRFKPYGTEYRTPSNFWLSDMEYIPWIYDQTMKAIRYLNTGGSVNDDDRSLIEAAINHSDMKAASKILGKYPVLSEV